MRRHFPDPRPGDATSPAIPSNSRKPRPTQSRCDRLRGGKTAEAAGRIAGRRRARCSSAKAAVRTGTIFSHGQPCVVPPEIKGVRRRCRSPVGTIRPCGRECPALKSSSAGNNGTYGGVFAANPSMTADGGQRVVNAPRVARGFRPSSYRNDYVRSAIFHEGYIKTDETVCET